MQSEITQLRKQVSFLRYYVAISSAACIVFLFSAFNGPEKKFGVIRAKGIVIEDGSGRDRILIGAPIPFSNDRVRTDTNLVRKYWAKNFEEDSNQYMQWYKNY